MSVIQNFNYHSHTYRCGHADLDMKDEEYRFTIDMSHQDKE